MARLNYYIECIFVSSEVVSFRIEIYDKETGTMVAKANNMINRKTQNGNVEWIEMRNTLSSEMIQDIHYRCLKRIECIGI